jgi:hypothetical protein
MPRYPHITVPLDLDGEGGNALAILGRMTRALRTAGVDRPTIADIVDEATSGDYDHLLATVRATVTTK